MRLILMTSFVNSEDFSEQIGVVGCGFVGGAMVKSLESKGIKPKKI